MAAIRRAAIFCKEIFMQSGIHILRTLYLHPVCRKLFALWLCFVAVVLVMSFCSTSWSQTCSINPSQPQAAMPGECVHFSASGCGSVNWTLTGVGTLDQSGQYCAPATIYPQNYSRGIQQLPNSNAYNVSVYNWPVHPDSQLWVNRIASDAPAQGSYHNFKLGSPPRFFQNLFNNSIDDSTPKQLVHAVLPWCVGCQDTPLPLLQPPFVEMQSGWSMDVYGASSGGTGPDRHLLQADRTSQLQYEYYQVMTDSHNVAFTPGNPTQVQFDTNVLRTLQTPLRMQVNGVTGSCSGMNFNGYASSSFLVTIVTQTAATNGYVWHVTATIPYDSHNCSGDFGNATLATSSSNVATANVGSMSIWSSVDNSVYGGPDAGGSSIVATSGDPVQWWNSVVNNYGDPNCGGCNTAFQHALRTTLGNQMISARVIPPASLYAAGGHPRMQLASCSPTNPIQCTSNYNLGTSGLDGCEAPTAWLSVTPGCQFHIVFTGLTGAWSLLNDNVDHTNTFYATAVTDSYHFTIPVDGRSLGAGSWNGNQYTMFDWAPYGTRFRLKRSFNVSGFCSGGLDTACPYEKAVLYTLQVYGMVLLDGTSPSDNWDTGILSNGFYPDQLVDAATALHNWSSIESSLEVVDPANTQPYWTPTAYLVAGNQEGTANQSRVSVCVNGSACADVNLQGTVVGIDPERLPLIPAGESYQAKVWVNGNPDTSHTCTLSPAVAGASANDEGVITAPSRGTLAAPAITSLVCASTAAPLAKGYATVEFVPWSPDGSLRLCFGCLKLSVTDHQSQVWYGQIKQRAVTNSYQPGSGLLYGPLYGSWNFYPSNWGSYTDAALYGASISHHNDVALHVALPNGQYTINLKGEAGLGVSALGENVYDAEVNGKVAASWQDGYLLAQGQYKGYTQSYAATVTDGVLSFVARDRQDTTASPYGMSVSGVQIVPSSTSPLQFTPPAQLPSATVGTLYQYVFAATGGVPPYTFTFTGGSLPPGVQLSGQGLLAGTPTSAGLYSFAVEVCDSTTPRPQCLSGMTTVSVNAPPAPPLQILTTSLPAGTKGLAYDVVLRGQGGVPPYKWTSSSPLPPGLQLTTAGEIKGTPSQSGSFTLSILLSDSHGTLPASAKLALTISALTPPVITTTGLPGGIVGKPYPATQLQATGGQAPYRWAITTGALPAGLTVSSTGLISGTPAANGSLTSKVSSFTVQVTDAAGQRATANLSITVRAITGTGPAGLATKSR